MSCCCRNRSRDPGLDCCHPENPFTPEKRICCDGECCGLFDEERRDCFWPDFTHPRSLCCRILYGCRRDDEDEDGIFDDREDSDDRDEGRRRRRCGCRG